MPAIFHHAARLLAAIALVSVAPACGGVGADGDAVLPPLNAFLIPTPGQDRAGSAGQAACASGTEAYDLTVALIEAENAALAGDRELLAAAIAAVPEGAGPIVTFEAEVDGRTLTIEAVIADSEVVLTGTLIDDEGEHDDYLSGVTANDQADGTLTLNPPGGEALNVVWSTSADTTQFVRTSGARSTAYDDSDNGVRIVSGETIISWDKGDYAGTVIDGANIMCFEGGEASDDFCDVTCSGDAGAGAGFGDVDSLDDYDF